MRRSSSTAASKENQPITSFSISNQFQSHDEDIFCYDKLESVHFESQELQTRIEALITRMKNDSNLQGAFRAEQGFLKVKKEDFVSYYNGLRDVYKGTKKLCGNWDSLFEDFSAKHSQSIAKKNKELESMVKHYRYKLKALEFEKKSALEEQKNDLLRREQEVLDSVNSFINSLKTTKKFWENNLSELHFCVQEHAQTIDYLVNHKSARLDAFSSEIDALFDDPPVSHRSGHNGNNTTDLKSTERQKEHVSKTKQPLSDLMNILSPITQELPKMDIPLSDKSKDSNLMTSKRGKDLSNNSYEDLFVFNKGDNGGGQMHGDSRDYGGKEEGGWDSNLDDEEEEAEKVDVGQIEKALALLFQNGLFGSHAVSMYEQIMQNTEESAVDREVHLNLFKENLRLQLKRHKTESEKQQNMLKKTNKAIIPEEDSIRESPRALAFRRKATEGPSVTRGQEYGHLKRTVVQREIQTQKGVNGQLISKEGGRKKNDISLSDLLGVKEYSFVLESPLSTHPNREEHSISFPHLNHAEKDDIMKADSLPVTMREGEFSGINGYDEESEQSALMESTRKREQYSSVKSSEESKNSNNGQVVCKGNSESQQKRNFRHYEEQGLTLASTVLNKKEIGFQGSEAYQNPGVVINTEGTSTLSPEEIKEIKGKSFNINTTDIKLSSIDTYPELAVRSGNGKENPLRKLTNRSSNLRNSHLTGSTNMRVSTKANTGFNEGEIYSTENARLTMYSSIDQTEKIAKHSFSGIVEMEEDMDEKIHPAHLSQTFPPYRVINDKDEYAKSPKVHGNNTSLREIPANDSRWQSKEITPFNRVKNI